MQWSEPDEVDFPLWGIAGHGDRTRSNRIHADLGGKFFRQTTRQHNDSGLGDRVRNESRPTQNSSDIGKINDRSIRFFEQRRCGLAAKENRLQICIQRGIPYFLRRRRKFGLQKVRGAVDQDV